MEQPNFAELRVLVVGFRGFALSSLRTVLTAAGVVRIAAMEDTRRALELLCTENFEAVFVEDNAILDDMPFALAARRSKALLNPMIPVFAVYSSARKRDVETARDLGVHDVIARPISPKTIKDKLGAAIVAPRPFIAAPEFFGPDRRAKPRSYRGDDRRVLTPKKTKIQVFEV
jgi:two-component system, chemotaxis family, chemotaxis protein CheY